jgi:hypothetical protein
MAFKPNELGQDQNHGIVCSNNPILFTYVPFWMSNKFHVGCFPFLLLKSSCWVFSFSSPKKFHVGCFPFLLLKSFILDVELDHNIL